MMNNLVIIYSPHDKNSREFVKKYPDIQALDWTLNSTKQKSKYFSNSQNPQVSRFPTVVDTEHNIAIEAPKSLKEAIEKIKQTVETRKKSEIQHEIDILLAKSDKYMLPDFPLKGVKIEEVIKYRKQLREIHLQKNYPENVVFPKNPVKTI